MNGVQGQRIQAQRIQAQRIQAQRIQVQRRTLCLAVEGSNSGFPELSAVARILRTADCTDIVPGRSLAPPTTDELRRALPPVKYAALRNVFAPWADAQIQGHGWGSSSAEERRVAQECAIRSGRQALELGARFLIVELGPLGGRPKAAPGFGAIYSGEVSGADEPSQTEGFLAALGRQQDRLVDQICRDLHAICAQLPGLVLALAPPELPALPSPDILGWILEDLGPRRVAYWHDPSRSRVLARAGLWSEEGWLGRFADRCVGVDLCDSVGGVCGLPAGCGEVDFAAVRSMLSRQCIGVVRADPNPGPAPLLESLRFLRDLGF